MGLSRRSPLAATALLALAIAAIVPSARGFAVEVAFNETECFSKQIENARDPDGSHELPFRVMGAYVVSKDPHKYYEMQRGERSLAVLQVEVTQPDGTIIHRDSEGRSRSEFDVTGAGVGTYSICFTNAGSKGKKAWMFALPHQKVSQERSAYVRVHYFQPVHADDDDEIDAHLAKSPRNTKSADTSVPRKAESMHTKQNSQTGKALSAGHASDINVLALNLQDEVSLMRQELFYLKARAGRHKKTADSNARRTLYWTVAEVVTLCAVAAVQVLAVRYFFSKDSGNIGKPGAGRAASGPGTMYGGASGGGFGGAGSFGSGAFAGGFGGGNGIGSAAAYGNPTAGPAPYGSGTGSYSSGAGASGAGGVLPPPPGQGTGSYSYGGQAQGIGGASVYGNQDGLRGRGGGAF